MLELRVDCANIPKMNGTTDFNRYCIQSEIVEMFTRNCGIKLQAALLGIFMKAEEEYAHIIQTKCKRKMTEKEELEIGEFLMDYVKDIDGSMVREFRNGVLSRKMRRRYYNGKI